MKRLAVCCDGTWNRADQEHDGKPNPTNVVRIAVRVAKRDGDTPQITYHHQGVGTGNALDRLSGGAFGEGLEENIFESYRFLVLNYEAGDQIFLFGFSRGAFTVRSLGGMIRKCGILKREHIQLYSDAVKLYRDGDNPDSDGPKAFRDKHAIGGSPSPQVWFIGVWDTVGSLGIPLRGLRSLTRKEHQFHDTQLSSTVRYAYHALALDEHRAPFLPTLWLAKPDSRQTVEQVWFCGAHSDVGGGYPERGLSDIALQWMIEKAVGAGLVFDSNVLAAHPIHPVPMQEPHDSGRGLYRLSPDVQRVVGIMPSKDGSVGAGPSAARDPSQSIHPSVRTRWTEDPKYRPRSLVDFYRTFGENA